MRVFARISVERLLGQSLARRQATFWSCRHVAEVAERGHDQTLSETGQPG